MNCEPTPEHAWLQQLVGEWDTESRMDMKEGAEVYRGRETGRAIGPFWVQLEGKGEMPGGGECTMVLTLGYDVTKKRFVGTWLGSMMSELWIYDITREEDGKTLTMAVEGPSMTGSGRCNYRDVIEWVTPDHRTLTSWAQGENGEWSKFMQADYRRRR